MNLKTGHQLAGGRYRVERVLGQGGFGITYLCEQTGLLRKVAIKEFFMREYCERDDDTVSITLGSRGSRDMVERFRQKFIKEARALATLNHKHIIRIIDVFEENNTAYYVMEYVGGGSLADKVNSGSLPEAVALCYIRQIASALDFVHGKRMMHLDVKPANILLNENDEAILIDFGLAKQYDSAGSQTSTTPVGISHGYAPLEQYKQGGVGTFSPATDIYSLGATLYKLLTGVTPPEAGDVMNDGLPALPQHISAPVRAAIEAAMQPRRKDRPQSISEFLSLLEGNVKAESGKVKTESNDDGETVIGASNEEGEKHPGGNVSKPPFNKFLAIISVVAACIVAVLVGIDSCNDRKEAEKEELERIAKEEERKAQERADSIAAEQQRLEQERKRREAAEKVEQERIAAERKTKEEAERKAKEDAERKAKEEAERLAAEKKRKEEENRKRREASNRSHGTINGHEYVDLGLSVKWATCNVGASSPGDYGRYYAWGETATKSDYSTSTTYGKQMNSIAGNSTYDVARREWGNTWRLPTKKEFQEIIDNCTWTWTTQNGHNGYKVTSKKNGNSIFLPAAGRRTGTSFYNQGASAYYWSATPLEGCGAYYLGFGGGYRIVLWIDRYYGHSVRPVSE